MTNHNNYPSQNPDYNQGDHQSPEILNQSEPILHEDDPIDPNKPLRIELDETPTFPGEDTLVLLTLVDKNRISLKDKNQEQQLKNSATPEMLAINRTPDGSYVIFGASGQLNKEPITSDMDISYSVGRTPHNSISFPENKQVSSDHLRIHFRNGLLLVTDLNSTNGTAATYYEQPTSQEPVSELSSPKIHEQGPEIDRVIPTINARIRDLKKEESQWEGQLKNAEADEQQAVKFEDNWGNISRARQRQADALAAMGDIENQISSIENQRDARVREQVAELRQLISSAKRQHEINPGDDRDAAAQNKLAEFLTTHPATPFGLNIEDAERKLASRENQFDDEAQRLKDTIAHNMRKIAEI